MTPILPDVLAGASGRPDPLDALLATLAAPPLADDGFSAQVLRRVQALQAERCLAPSQALAAARRRQDMQRRRVAFSAAGALAGAVLAAAWGLLAPDSAWPWLAGADLAWLTPAAITALASMLVARAMLVQAEV